jgi:hypothetical protein
MIHASLDMQAALRPSKWYLETIGGLRCHDKSVSMSRHVICAIEQSCSTGDHPESSILLELLRRDGRSLVSILSLNYQTPMGMMRS